MLPRRIRPRLCPSCRNDLSVLFENGFGSSPASRSPRRQNYWSYSPRSLCDGKATRALSSKHPLCNPKDIANSAPDVPRSDADTVAEMYRAQVDAIKQQSIMPKVGDVDEYGLEYTAERLDEIAHHLWEAENAGVFESPEATARATKSLQEALEQHERVSEVLAKSWQELGNKVGDEDESGAGAPTDDNGQSETEPRNPLEALRDSDASVEEVVREARHQHGEYLPDGVLSEDESKTYRRLYGEPFEEVVVVADEMEIPDVEEGREPQELLDKDGELIAYHKTQQKHDQEEKRSPPVSGSSHLDHAKSIEQRAMEVAEQIGGEIQPYGMDEGTEGDPAEKAHPLTVVGRFQTSPRTVFLPQKSFVQPIQKILSEYSNKHVKEMCERLFGGKGLPNSPLTPRLAHILPQTAIPLDASQHLMGTMEANAYVAAVWPSTYAAVSSVLVETRKRLGSNWLRDLLTKDGGASVLDAGGGGVGILAWRDIINAEWEALHTSDASPPAPPPGKATVLTGADNLRYRAATLLENTTFLPRLPDYVHVRDSATLSDDRPASQRKQYDVIIAPHTLWSLGEEWQRKQQVQNLWSLLNPDGGVLILLEKGVPRGFEVIAGARELLLGRYIATADSPTYESKLESSNEEGTVQKGKGMIIAPCTNHAPCPMYPVPGVSRGRKDYCSFQQRYIRPHFLQRVLGAKDRNHDDVDFSYVAVQKGRDLQDSSTIDEPVVQGKDATDSAFEGYEDAVEPGNASRINSLTLPRLVFPPLKRPGHVTVDVCTPAGKIDRWTITRSFSKVAYRDARKVSWGDLWALGAKTSVPRNLSLGGEKSKKGKSQEERLMSKARSILDRRQEDKKEQREVEAELDRSEEEEEDAVLDPEDFDADAAEVLREIEQETKQRKAGPRSQTQQRRQRRGPITASPQDGTTSSQSPQRGYAAGAQPVQQSSANTTLEDPSAKKSQEDIPNGNQNPSVSPPSPPRSHISTLTPQESASLKDFAAESRVDHLKSLANDRLSRSSAKLRLRRGENKFKEPEKEAWRAMEEGRKIKKRAEKKRYKANRREMIEGGSVRRGKKEGRPEDAGGGVLRRMDDKVA